MVATIAKKVTNPYQAGPLALANKKPVLTQAPKPSVDTPYVPPPAAAPVASALPPPPPQIPQSGPVNPDLPKEINFDPYNFETIDYYYKPQLQADAERQVAPSLAFDRYSQGQNANAAVSSGIQTGAAGIASSTGLSAADRAALEAQGQRQRVMGAQQAQAPFNQMQAQNLYDTNQTNVQNAQTVSANNQQIMNQYMQDEAEAKQRKADIIFQAKLEDALLQKKLEAAHNVAF